MPSLAADEVVVVRGVRTEATASAVTVVEVDEDLPAWTDVAGALEPLAGLHVTRLGGLGDFAAVSIRGSSLRQVGVYLDGLPLNPDGSGALDLSELPLRAFDRIEVYRGGAPLGGADMGGAVNLVLPEGAVAPEVSLTTGSWGTSRVQALAGPAGELAGVPVQGFLAADLFATRGDFRFLDDRATRYNPGDDAVLRRDNNDARHLSTLARLRVGDLVVHDALLVRDEGLPGHVGFPTPTTRFGVRRNLLGIGLRGDVDLHGWSQVREERLRDLDNDRTTGARHTRDTTSNHGLRASGAFTSDAVSVVVSGEGRLDRFVARDVLTGEEEPPVHRAAATLSARGTVRLGDLALFPVLEGRALETWDERGKRILLLAATPRAGILYEPHERWTLKANAGRYLRPPDFLELFGEHGGFVGRSDLRPERGWQVDLGARHTLPAGSVEATVFATAAEDLVVYVQNAQRTAYPVNLGRARVTGVEAAADLVVARRLRSRTSVTGTVSVNRSEDPSYAGNRLPRVPAVELHQRTGLDLGPVTLGHDFSYVAGNYWDATNWFSAAPRALHGAFVRWAPGRELALELDVLNLGDRLVEQVPRNPLDPADTALVDQPLTDLVGYPLPGRTVLLTVRWAPSRSSR